MNKSVIKLTALIEPEPKKFKWIPSERDVGFDGHKNVHMIHAEFMIESREDLKAAIKLLQYQEMCFHK